ncbi:MAG: toll/interleukin-1 receptor domain-containing protein, partial [Arenicella sp.]|nr:toll/interleukin-1 receptor domain-containing protein [Arenicella sp.]
MSHDVFISHSSIDKSIADAVTAALEQAQIRCWIAPRDILPGESWGGSIVDAIESSKVMVIIFSSHSNDSKQVMREVERAVQKDVVVVPVRVENVQPSRDMEYFLSATHWLDAITPEMDVHLKDLTATVQALLNKSPSSSATAPPPAPPPPVAAEASARPRSKLTMLVPVLGLLAVVGAGLWFFGGSPEQSSEPRKASSTSSDNVADNKPTDQPAEKKQSGDIRLKVADKVMAAAQMQVDWGGEAAARDAVMIANPDAQDSAYLQRVVIKNNKPINITAPDKPGVFEIRFLDAASRSVIARRDLIVELPELSLSSPDSICAVKNISVDC